MIKKFEDIKAWKKAQILKSEINKITRRPCFKDDYNLKNQVKGSSLSIMNNIAEGFGRNTKKEFVHFLYIAHGSAAETQSSLYDVLDQDFIDQKEFDELYHDTGEVSRMISGLINYLLNRKKREYRNE